ncbi:autotransporter-associated beta strand repeat-containing protein [Luteolibacter soli]|uniref:Autotransporter-associated beta strand repeat-containing protein n=1 Tax=Luteolibacter soli TaxID=3135280 RepID=A0ABU9AS50_9BACT
MTKPLFFLVQACGALTAVAQIPAFPGAEGFAAYATGGRGGDVYHVTNTNGSGAGSLNYGLTTGVPAAGRTIVFDVSGYATITSTLRITSNKITVAGQTAPGDGFGLKNNTVRVSGNNNVFRFLRLRDGLAGDAVDVDSTATNTLFDHCDVIFAHDENHSSFNDPPDLQTFQWSNNAWGLESHSAGGLWDVNRATVHHSLWAHNHTRNPKARPNGLLDWVNNVTFDYDIGFILGDSQTPADWKTNVVGSYFIASSSSGSPFSSASKDSNGNPNFSVYVNGNYYDSDKDRILDGTLRGSDILGSSLANVNLLASAVARSAGVPVTEDANALLAYKKIVSACGPLRMDANPNRPLRDELNGILTNNLVTQRRHRITYGSLGGSGATNGGFGTLISSPAPTDTDQDGMPDYWEKAVGYSHTVANNNTLMPTSGGVVSGTTYFPPATPAGYTQLEEYLHFKAIPHRAVLKDNALDIDLGRYTSGFTSGPTFTVSNVTGGAVTLSGTGNSQAHYVPPANYTGRAMFDFTVTDTQGSTWTQTFAILVSGDPLPVDPVSDPLVWKGNGTTHTWNSTASNQVWMNGETPSGFGDTDTATFDDSGSNSPAITVSGTVQPSAVTVDSTKNYTFTGTGAIGGAASLTKSGSGTLTLANTGANTFPLDILIDGGAVVIGNNSSMGNGPLEFLSGTLTSQYTGSHTLPNLMTIPGGSNVAINMSPQMKLGGVSGSGNLNLNVTATATQNSRLNGSWSGFTGTLNLSATGAQALISANFNGDATNGAFNNLNAATVNLDNVNLGGRDNSGGNTFTIGALSGTSTAKLGGAHYAGVLTYSIGALNKNTAFDGTITNSTSSTDTASGANTILTKTGSGTLTWNGGGSHTGATNINAGTFTLNGTFGRTATTVANGAKFAGSGRIGDSVGGSVTAASGSTLIPGATGQDGRLQLAALTLNGATLQYDLSNTAGVNDTINDRISTQNTLTITGTQNFQFNLTNGGLGAGTYTLIDGGSNTILNSPVLNHNLPATTRQSFALTSSAAAGNPAFVQLTVTGNPESLVWTGTTNSTWDLNSSANWTGTPGTFYNLDAVTFNDSSAVGAVTLTGNLQPKDVTFSNSTTAYTLSGSGGIAGSAALIKSGTGTLALSTANTYTRGTTINGGTVSAGTATALGSGFVALNGSTLQLGGSALTLANELRNTGNSILATTSGNNTLTGILSGTGSLAFHLPAGGLMTLQGNIDAFAGSIALTGSGGTLRFNPATTSGGGWGNANVAFNAGTQVINNRALTDVTIPLGALSGSAGSQLRGSDQAGPAVDTYVIGTLNTDTSFAGGILNGTNATPHTTALTKVGTGTLTLSGSSSYGGDTAVNAGTLSVSGLLSSSTGDLDVASGATLRVAGGTVIMDQIVIDAGGTLDACGTLVGDLVNNGTMLSSCGVKLTIHGDVVNHGTFRVTSGTDLELTGSLTNTGLLDLLTADVSSEVLASIVNEGVVLDSSKVKIASASLTNGFTVTIQSYAGHNYRLQRSASLTAASWSDVGTPQAGNGSVLTFNDPAAANNAGFYRIFIDP